MQDNRANPHRCPPLPCVCLRLTPSALHLHITGLTPVTSHHCHMHAKSLQLQKCTHLARALTAACGSGFGLISSRWSTQLGSPANSPQHYKGICSWLSIAKRVHITTSGHHHCLSWPQTLDLRVPSRTQTALTATVDLLQCLSRACSYQCNWWNSNKVFSLIILHQCWFLSFDKCTWLYKMLAW